MRGRNQKKKREFKAESSRELKAENEKANLTEGRNRKRKFDSQHSKERTGKRSGFREKAASEAGRGENGEIRRSDWCQSRLDELLREFDPGSG